jgi:acyl-homoserine-lactone acylase
MFLLADQVVKYNSQRSRYFGPDRQLGSGDSYNLINDFSFKALEIRAQAESGLQTMSDNVRAMLSGYTKGYNHYLQTTPTTQQDSRCAGKPWLQPIDEVDLLTYALGITLLPGSAQFLAPIFIASPPGESFAPQLALSSGLGKPYSIDVLDIA